jgi:hypothetical protein
VLTGRNHYTRNDPSGWNRLPFYPVLTKPEGTETSMWPVRAETSKYAMVSPAIIQSARRGSKGAETAVGFVCIQLPSRDEIVQDLVGMKTLCYLMGAGRMYKTRRRSYDQYLGVEVSAGFLHR